LEKKLVKNKPNAALTGISNGVDKIVEVTQKAQEIILPGSGRRKMFLCVIGVIALTYLIEKMIVKGNMDTVIIWSICCLAGIIAFFFGFNIFGDHLGEFLVKKIFGNGEKNGNKKK